MTQVQLGGWFNLQRVAAEPFLRACHLARTPSIIGDPALLIFFQYSSD